MVGTPNRGSFAIPLTLIGRREAREAPRQGATSHHSHAGAARDHRHVPGPVPDAAVAARRPRGRPRAALRGARAGGSFPSSKALLARATRSCASLDKVTDPRASPLRRRREPANAGRGSGSVRRRQFSYRESLDGDGRVPHELGLLEGVTTYWVDEACTATSPSTRRFSTRSPSCSRPARPRSCRPTKPAKPRAARGSSSGWVSGDDVAPLAREVDAILARPKLERSVGGAARADTRRSRSGSRTSRSPSTSARARSAARSRRGRQDGSRGRRRRRRRSAAAPRPTLAVEVVWGDVTKVDADVYTVGHYEGVAAAARRARPRRGRLRRPREEGLRPAEPRHHPAHAAGHPSRRGGRRLVLPVGRATARDRVVAVAGMGRPGTFDARACAGSCAALAIAVERAPRRPDGLQRPDRLRRGHALDRGGRARLRSTGSRTRRTRSRRAGTTCSPRPSRS